jgi:hypothetical protein
MTIIPILNEWWTSGRLSVEHPISSREFDDAAIADWIRRVEPEYRSHLPDGMPTLDVSSAVWACTQVLRAAQLIVYRELGDDAVDAILQLEPADLSTSTPVSNSIHENKTGLASHHYSVDLFFRFLPDLLRITQAIDSHDRLLDFLRSWAMRWPISGAKISGAKISGAKISGAKISGAKISGAKISGAKISGAKISGASVSGVVFDDEAMKVILVDAPLRLLFRERTATQAASQAATQAAVRTAT